MLSDLAKPFGLLLMWLYELTTNYGVAIILFGLIVKLILLPFQVKSKKSMMRMTRLQPQVKELEKKYAGDQQKYSLEVNKLYRENRINPMSGCLWSLLPFPILLALYQAIRYPLTIMMGVPSSMLEEGGAIAEKLASMNFSTTLSTAYSQIAQSQFITKNFDAFAGISEKLKAIDFSFLGLDLTQMPRWNFFLSTDWSTPAVWGQALALFLMPVLAAGITYISSKLASATNTTSTNANDDPTANTMKGMTMMMPVMTLVFGFMMPASMCLYWIVSMGLGAIQDAILNRNIRKQLEGEEAEYKQRWAEKEAKLEAKRRETERLRAENATSQNRSTSKSKVQKIQKEAQKAKESQWEKENIGESETVSENPSKIGNRKYAKGRNYDPDRYNRD